MTSSYYEHERPEVVAIVPHDVSRVLELGCAGGGLAAALKRRQDCHVTGVEYSAEPAARASTRLDRVIVGDCENLDLEALFELGEFDCLIAADVLEHLRDPEHLLRRLQPFLTPNAVVVVSLPNVRHAGVLQAAVEGYWTYRDEGILDRTHLRFFTRREIENMFVRLGFDVEERRTVDDPALEEWERLGRPTSPRFGPMTLNGLNEQELREFFVIQWLVRSRAAVRSGASLAVDELSARVGPVPPIVVTESETKELTSRLVQERAHVELLQAKLARGDEELIRRDAELARRDVELAGRLRETEGLHRALLLHKHEYELLAAANQSLRIQGEDAQNTLAIVLSSISWRMTRPLRAVTRYRPSWRAPIRHQAAGRARIRRALRRAARLMWLAVTMQLPGRIFARLAGSPAGVDAAPMGPASVYSALPAIRNAPQTTPKYVLRRISITDGSNQLQYGKKGRLVCMTHVLPYPPRAGNEYRIHHMLNWLTGQGWDVLLLVHPLPDEPISNSQVTEAAAQYSNLIVCERNGTLHYRLRGGGTMVKGLHGRRPRVFAELLQESDNQSAAELQLLNIQRTFCPDLLVELLLHLESEFDPHVLLAEYVFMTRGFPLLRPGLIKIVDTIDVFSSKQSKVTQYGIEDSLALTPDMEAELLDRADLLIAIQPDEAEKLRKLTPKRQVISVGVDFSLLEHGQPPPSRPIVLLVGSGNRMNVKGLKDFLRFAWPLVRETVPGAELQVIGAVGQTVDPCLPGIRVLGRVENLDAAYADAHVVINPAVAGTGLKIKTVEALCHLRPVVLWPAGADGLGPEMRALCHIATNWFNFACQVIELLRTPDGAQLLIDRRSELASQFAPDTVYAPLAAALDVT